MTDSPNLLNCVRNYAEIGDNSSVTIIEEYIGEDTVIYLTNSITEISGGKNCDIDHYKYQNESNTSFHFQTVEAT